MKNEQYQNLFVVDIKTIARLCHEINRIYCASIGDTSQPKWEDAPEWQQKSAINGVVFHINNKEAGPSGSHKNWLSEKVADGWVYGEVKDPTNKTHPCCVPYEQLPKSQQYKDDLFVTVVKSLTY